MENYECALEFKKSKAALKRVIRQATQKIWNNVADSF